LHERYRDQGLAILGFPCNQFGNQEPGTNEEIKAFAQGKYNVKFDLFSKIEVNGDNAHPLWKWLKSAKGGFLVDAIKWNWTKFLIDRDGKPVERFATTVNPLAMEDKIKEQLAKPASS
jgi:glutathione peroxidase-family protein